MKLKLDANGNVVVRDGKPVYENEAGEEIAFDAPGTVATIARLNSEAKTHRLAKEAAETKLTAFGDLDPEAARNAIKLVKNYDDKKLVDAGKVDEVKAEVNKAWEQKYSALEQSKTQLETRLHNEVIGGSFSRSKFIADKLAIPADIVQATFGKHFKLEGEKIVALDANGQPIYSKANPGNPASFDEALESLVGGYANRDAILKSPQRGGGGANPGGGGSGGGSSNVVSRSQLDAMAPEARNAHFAGGGKVVDG